MNLSASVGVLKLEFVRRGTAIRRLNRRVTQRVAVKTTAGIELLRVRIGKRR